MSGEPLWTSLAQVECFRHNLTPDEQKRADGFYFQRDRRRFITARGVLTGYPWTLLEHSTDKIYLSAAVLVKACTGLEIRRRRDPL